MTTLPSSDALAALRRRLALSAAPRNEASRPRIQLAPPARSSYEVTSRQERLLLVMALVETLAAGVSYVLAAERALGGPRASGGGASVAVHAIATGVSLWAWLLTAGEMALWMRELFSAAVAHAAAAAATAERGGELTSGGPLRWVPPAHKTLVWSRLCGGALLLFAAASMLLPPAHWGVGARGGLLLRCAAGALRVGLAIGGLLTLADGELAARTERVQATLEEGAARVELESARAARAEAACASAARAADAAQAELGEAREEVRSLHAALLQAAQEVGELGAWGGAEGPLDRALEESAAPTTARAPLVEEEDVS